MKTRRGRAALAPIGGEPAPQSARERYFYELRRLPILPAERQKELARTMRDRTRSPDERAYARAELIKTNLRFASSIAWKYRDRGLALDDLISEANAGLCRAVDKYDPDVGVNFISYAVWWIRQAILLSISTTGRSVRLPLGRAADLARIGKAADAFRACQGRSPAPEEIAGEVGLSIDIVKALLAIDAAKEVSLDAPVSEHEPTPFARFIPDETTPAPDASLTEADVVRAVDAALSVVTDHERAVLHAFFGLGGEEPETLEQIGDRMGVSRERVRQLKEKALGKLRASGHAGRLVEALAA